MNRSLGLRPRSRVNWPDGDWTQTVALLAPAASSQPHSDSAAERKSQDAGPGACSPQHTCKCWNSHSSRRVQHDCQRRALGAWGSRLPSSGPGAPPLCPHLCVCSRRACGLPVGGSTVCAVSAVAVVLLTIQRKFCFRRNTLQTPWTQGDLIFSLIDP